METSQESTQTRAINLTGEMPMVQIVDGLYLYIYLDCRGEFGPLIRH